MNTQLFDFLDPLNQPMMLDSAAGQAAAAIGQADSLNDKALNSEIQSMRKAALIAVFILADSIAEKDLAEDELPSDRLDSLIAGIASGADDEELDLDDSAMDMVIACMQDALATLGVSDELIASMFSTDSEADEAIEAAAEIVISNTPTGDDIDELVDLFVYGEAEDDEWLLDGVSLGKTTIKSGKFGKVVYKAIKAIRNGKVAIVNKRVSGKVKLSAKQRAALNKARKKAGSSASVSKRIRSMAKARKL